MDELQNRVLKCDGMEVIRLSSGLVLGNAHLVSGLFPDEMSTLDEAARRLRSSQIVGIHR